MNKFFLTNKKRILSLFLVSAMVLSYTPVYAAQVTPPVTTGGAVDTTSPYAAIEKVAQEKAEALIKTYGATSVQYALIDNGKITVSGNSGVFSKTENTKLDNNSMYAIASISKMFATSALMKLVDMGKVNLDTPVVNYIEEFTMADSRYKDITPRMLVNHSSGLMGSTLEDALLFDDNDTFYHDTFLDKLKTQRLKANPGAFSVYCNDGFTLAEILIERISGMSFTQFVAQYITGPMGLTNTKTSQSGFDRSKLSKNYYYLFPQALPADFLNGIGLGGMFSTAEDLCNFGTAFMKDSKSFLSAESVNAMKQAEYKKGIWPAEGDNILGYGLGWDSVDAYPFNKYNITALTKGGDTQLTHSSLIVLPDKNMAVAVLTNGSSSSYNQIMGQEMLLAALKEKNQLGTPLTDDIVTKNSVSVPIPSEVKDMAGLYMGLLTISLKVVDDYTLTLAIPNFPTIPPTKLIYTSGGYFTTTEGGMKLKMIKEKNGNTYLYTNAYTELPGLGKTAMSQYEAEKVLNNDLTDNQKKSWKHREGKRFYMVSEKYSSQYYLQFPAAEISFLLDAPGYFANAKIADNKTALAFLQIPGTMGRDLSDYTFYEKDGSDYFKTISMEYISQDAIKYLPKSTKSTITLAKNGDAKWYKVGKSKYGKTMTVKLPKKSSFAVYDKTGVCKNFSVVTNSNTTKLAKGDFIVFVGSPSAKFNVTFQ